MRQVKWYVRRTTDGGWQGVVDLPMDAFRLPAGHPLRERLTDASRSGPPRPPRPDRALPGAAPHTLRVRSKGASKAAAAAKAARGAMRLLNNPLIKAALPPGVGPALMAVNSLVSSKKARRIVGRFGKKGLRMLTGFFAKKRRKRGSR